MICYHARAVLFHMSALNLDPMIVAAILESWSATIPPMYSVGDGPFGKVLS